MLRFCMLLVLLSTIAAGCAYYDSGVDGSISDGQADGDGQPDGDAGPDKRADWDADGGGGPVLKCTPNVTRCPTDLDCLCCGSIGPSPICLCSRPCEVDTSCQARGLSHCNTPDENHDGICTPPDFNCCWYCE